jgi:hypothetical protein
MVYPIRKGSAIRTRILTFDLNIPAEGYTAHAAQIAPGFTAWPGLLGKRWLGDRASGTLGGVYVFAPRQDTDRSRQTDLFRDVHQAGAQEHHRPGVRRPRGADRDYRIGFALGFSTLTTENRMEEADRGRPTGEEFRRARRIAFVQDLTLARGGTPR